MALIKEISGRSMCFAAGSRAAENAVLAGSVTLCEGANVWYGAVLRGDTGTITIGKNSTVEDQCVLHGTVFVGEDCVIGHGAMLHHCELGDRVLIGIGAIVLSGAKIGTGSIVAAGAVVTEGTVIPPGSMVMGVPGRIKRQVSQEEQERTRLSAGNYLRYAAEQLPPAKEE